MEKPIKKFCFSVCFPFANQATNEAQKAAAESQKAKPNPRILEPVAVPISVAVLQSQLQRVKWAENIQDKGKERESIRVF